MNIQKFRSVINKMPKQRVKQRIINKEPYREIRTNIEHFNMDKSITSILVTSSKDGEGKTSLVSNLSLSFANINKKILLIDCNFQNPSIHKEFHIENEQGLIDIFIHEKEFEKCIHRYKKSNLDILTTGNLDKYSSEILSQNKMKEFLYSVKSIYDYVFIDTPSIGTSIDAGIISQYTDGTIFVISPNTSTKGEISTCKHKLENLEANIIGVVFNKYNEKKFKNKIICYSK